MNTKNAELARLYMSTILVIGSANTTAAISVDRCLHIVKLSNYQMSKKITFTIIGTCWMIPILTSIVRLLPNGKVIYRMTVNIELTCILAINICFYGVIVFVLNRYTKQHSNELSNCYVQNQRRAARTVVAIVTVFILMNLPLVINFYLYISKQYSVNFIAKSYVFGDYFAVSNSVVNPLIYCYPHTFTQETHIGITSPERDSNRKSNRV